MVEKEKTIPCPDKCLAISTKDTSKCVKCDYDKYRVKLNGDGKCSCESGQYMLKEGTKDVK
jgi:ribosomal protein L40E